MVDALADRPDAEPGDGVCADLVGLCTLRAAITEANGLPRNDVITFAVSGTIVLRATLPEVGDAGTTGALEIDGGGEITVSGNDAVGILSVASGGNLTLRNLRLERGRSDRGGAISSGGTLTIENSTFSGNSAGSPCGAIYSWATLTIERSTFSGNSAASGSGGAIRSEGTLRAVGVRLLENQAEGDGGGVYTTRTARMENSTLARNRSRRGGGVFNTGDLRLVNVTLSENAATEDGGGFFHDPLLRVADVIFSTFYLNAAGARGSAIFDEVNASRIKNSIIAGAEGVGNCFGVFSPAAATTLPTTTCLGFAAATREALALAPPADNGGATETHALLAGSVAMDSAPDCNDLEGVAVSSDQRGAPRPFGPACDVGAYEAGATPPTSTPTLTITVGTLTPAATETVTATPPGPTATPTSAGTATAAPTGTSTPTATRIHMPTFTLTPSYTATPSVTPTPPPAARCAGDCSGDGAVTIDELLTVVSIALDTRPVEHCSAADPSADGEITIDEIVEAVNRALSGCRARER